MVIEFSNPTLIAALGAFFGVILTLSGQLLTSRRQRSHDRITKLFEYKLELYRELVEALERSTKAWSTTTEAAVVLKKEHADLQQLAEFNNEIEEFVGKYSDGQGGLSSGLDAAARERARALSKRYEELSSLRAEVKERAHADGQGNDKQIEEFLSSRDDLVALRSRVELVAEERLLSEFTLVLQKILLGVEVEDRELNGAKNAARAELGLRDRRIVARIYKTRSKGLFRNQSARAPQCSSDLMR